jgi:monovalent cation/hydrogen antiporter
MADGQFGLLAGFMHQPCQGMTAGRACRAGIGEAIDQSEGRGCRSLRQVGKYRNDGAIMIVFEWILVVLLGAVVLAALARRLRAPYPAFLALGGVALAFIPGSPTWTLEPELALALFVAPVLMDAAFDASPRDLKDNWKVLAGLVLVAVLLTTAAVAFVAHALVPGLPWMAAIALGAAVSPPDAAAATAILRQVRLPHRLVTILEGESLLNDASALLIYRLAVGAVAAGSLSFADIAPTFVMVVIGSLAIGPLLAILFQRLTAPMQDIPSRIVVQFVATFGIWIFAERVGLSGILTIVSYAITIARSAPARTPARFRVPTYAVWDTAVFVVNVLAFVMIGLQLGPIWARLDPTMRLEYGLVAAAVLAAVILTRFAWVMTYNTIVRLHIARYGFHPPRPMMKPTVQSGLIVSWCGMRGIVTLAAAFALPEAGPDGQGAFPFRDLIVFTAFCVVLGTLVLQGLTLRPILQRFQLTDDDPVSREVGRARIAAFRAALATLEGDQSPEAEALRLEYIAVLQRAEQDPDGSVPIELPGDHLRRRAIQAARTAVDDLRAKGEIGDNAFHRIEEELDWAELAAAPPRSG